MIISNCQNDVVVTCFFNTGIAIENVWEFVETWIMWAVIAKT